MADFSGNKCIVCSGKFDAGSDVVVCPDCGTPYHRDCYFIRGSCVNTALHKSGKSWKPAADIGNQEIMCAECEELNPPLTAFCENCGQPLPLPELSREKVIERYMQVKNQARTLDENPKEYNKNEYGGIYLSPHLINFSDRLCGYSPDEDFDGVKLSEIGDFVDTNTHYYLPVFKRIKDTGKALTWNFIAMVFPELYFANRKMPLIAFMAFALRYITLIPTFIEGAAEKNMGVLTEFAMMFDLRDNSFQALSLLLRFTSYVIMFAGGGLSNWIYYKLSLKKINNIKSRHEENAPDLTETLRRKGGTSALLLSLFIILYFLPFTILYIYEFLFLS